MKLDISVKKCLENKIDEGVHIIPIISFAAGEKTICRQNFNHSFIKQPKWFDQECEIAKKQKYKNFKKYLVKNSQRDFENYTQRKKLL